METFGKLCISFIVFIISVLTGGVVLTFLWDWFMVTIFSLPSLTVAQSLGVMATSRFMFSTPKKSDVSDEDIKNKFGSTIGEILLKLVVSNLMILLSGWIIYQFV